MTKQAMLARIRKLMAAVGDVPNQMADEWNVETVYGVMRVTASTAPTGLTVNVTYNGSPTPPINAGSYTITGTVSDATYDGVQSGTLSIDKATQTVTFPPPSAQLTTNTVGLAASASSALAVSFSIVSGPGQISGGTNLTFTGTGGVAVAATQGGNSNWYPSAITNLITVTKAVAPVTLIGLTQPYSGTSLTVTAATQPTGLVVIITYDGSGTAPSSVGPHSIIPSATGTPATTNLGSSSRLATPADYDGDGRADPAVYYPATGTWFIRNSSGGSLTRQWGPIKFLPVAPQFQLNRKYFPTP